MVIVIVIGLNTCDALSDLCEIYGMVNLITRTPDILP